MKVNRILNEVLTDVTPNMHQVRRESLQAMISSLLHGAALTVTSLGRNIDSQTSEKHQIKRSTRLLSNQHIHFEQKAIYKNLALRLVANQKHPIILVDWSDLDPRKQNFLLRAAIAIEGRSLTLIEAIYPLNKKEKPATHRQFMERLKSILPKSCCPIIVTDAGFRVPWFMLIKSLGWDYVGRVRNKTFCARQHDNHWYPVKSLYQFATGQPKSLGQYQMSRRNPIDCCMVVYRRKAKGRKDFTACGQRTRASKHSRASASREKEPWLLATSLYSKQKNLADKVVRIYRSRMQIEESFRDLKTGLNFNQSDTRDSHRLSVLLLIAMIAQFILFLIGLTVCLLGAQRRYQANSIKDKRVLSFQFIAIRAIKDRTLKIKRKDLMQAQLKIVDWISRYASV